jgi:hypothetical protein
VSGHQPVDLSGDLGSAGGPIGAGAGLGRCGLTRITCQEGSRQKYWKTEHKTSPEVLGHNS